jgi:flagellar biosynthesis/type III secretory pathway protein FliH
MRRIDAANVPMEPLWQTPAVAPCGMAPVAAVDPMEVERAAVLEAAYQEGHALGLKRAKEVFDAESSAWQAARRKELDELERQLVAAQGRLGDLIRAVPVQMERQAERAEEVALEVAYAALAKLLGEQYPGGEVLRALVRDGIRQAGHAVSALRVAADDAAHLADMEIKVIPDAGLSPGQCILETACGYQACGLDVRLDSLRRAFLAGLAQHRGPGSGA